MALKIPDEVVISTSPHLFFKKYPHKINIVMKTSRYWSRNYESEWAAIRTFTINQNQEMAKLLDKWPKGSYRTRYESSNVSFFLETEEQVQTLLDHAIKVRTKFAKKNPSSPANGKSVIHLATMTAEQATNSLQDAKIEYRKCKFHSKWTWKIEANLDKKDVSDYEAVRAQLFSREQIEEYESSYGVAAVRSWFPAISSDSARITMTNGWASSKLTVYIDDEYDVATVRLMISGKTKLTKAVVVQPK